MAVKTQNNQAQSKQRSAPGVVQDVQKGIQPVQGFITKFNNDWVMNLSAALAYNLLTAIFPIGVAILAILGLILGHLSPSSMDNLTNGLQNVFPSAISSNKDLFKTLTQQLNHASGPLGIIAFVIALFSGSRLFILMENCFDLIYHVKPRAVIRQNLVAIGMLLLFVILVPIMFFASTLPTLALSLLKYTPLSTVAGSGFLITIGGILAGLIASYILFLSIYIVVPNQKISFHNSWLGALVAAVLLELFLTLFPLYISHFMTGYVGQVGFAVILLAFFYYFAVILLLGVEVNAYFAEKVVATPADIVTMVHDWTSHEPKSAEAQEKQAALSHKPINPDKGFTLDPAQKAQQLGKEAQQKQAKQPGKQNQAATQAQMQPVHTSQAYDGHGQTEDHAQSEKKGGAGTSKIMTILGAVAGTALAFLVELVRLNRRKPGAS